MSDNLQIWNRFADIDPQFTKPITGKAYKGTSPNPHYVLRCLTELFGPVGQGFGWEVKAEGFEQLGEEVLHWCRIRFWHGDGAGFEAYGQTKAYMKTRNGFMADEDAPKKSLTDAITKAAAQVGVGANIFLGRWDDSRYVAQVNGEYRSKEQADAPLAPGDVFKAATDAIEKAADMEALRAAWANLTDSEAWKGAPEKWQQKASACFDRNLGRLTPDVEVKDVPPQAATTEPPF